MFHNVGLFLCWEFVTPREVHGMYSPEHCRCGGMSSRMQSLQRDEAALMGMMI